jgi:MtN3 and saliva related transmembrane protein
MAKYLQKSMNMDMTQLIGIGAGLLTAFSMLPQLIKIIKEKKAEEISIVMVLVLLAGLIMWTVYGIMKMDWPIIITNCFSILINILLLIFRIKYK